MQEKVDDNTFTVGKRVHMMLHAGTAEQFYAMVEVLFCSFLYAEGRSGTRTKKRRWDFDLTRLVRLETSTLNQTKQMEDIFGHLFSINIIDVSSIRKCKRHLLDGVQVLQSNFYGLMKIRLQI